MSRAIRRHHIERLKRKRMITHKWAKTPRELSIAVKTPRNCSCFMCKNQRYARRDRIAWRGEVAYAVWRSDKRG